MWLLHHWVCVIGCIFIYEGLDELAYMCVCVCAVLSTSGIFPLVGVVLAEITATSPTLPSQ